MGALPAATALAIGLLLLPARAAEPSGQSVPASLPALARAADLVALAQVADTDYRRRRNIPVSGSAYLKLLIPYKVDRPRDLIEVYEKGLHEHECYFPTPTVFEEGRRYLLFLRRDPDDPERYRGLPQGCAVEVLVDQENRYAVRVPVTGLELSTASREAVSSRMRAMVFRDRYAVLADEELPPAQRDAMREARQIAPWPAESDDETRAGEALPPPASPPRQWIYTRGVPLGEFRELLELTPDI